MTFANSESCATYTFMVLKMSRPEKIYKISDLDVCSIVYFETPEMFGYRILSVDKTEVLCETAFNKEFYLSGMNQKEFLNYVFDQATVSYVEIRYDFSKFSLHEYLRLVKLLSDSLRLERIFAQPSDLSDLLTD